MLPWRPFVVVTNIYNQWIKIVLHSFCISYGPHKNRTTDVDGCQSDSCFCCQMTEVRLPLVIFTVIVAVNLWMGSAQRHSGSGLLLGVWGAVHLTSEKSEIHGRSELWMTGIKLLVIPNGTQLPFQFLALCTVCQFSSRSRGWAGMDQRIFMITCHAAPCHLRSTRWQRAQEKATVKLSVYFPC